MTRSTEQMAANDGLAPYVQGSMNTLQTGPAAAENTSSIRQAAEHAIARLVGGRYGIFFGPMAVTVALWLWRGSGAETAGTVLGGATLISAWYLVWIRTSWDRPLLGSMAAQGALTLVGALSLGMLGYVEYAFVVVAATMYPRFFMTMPFPWAYLCSVAMMVPADIGSRAAAPGPAANGNVVFFVRLVVLAVVGLFVRAFVEQLDGRRRLAEQLAQAERRAGKFEERQRLAREIHDSLAQGFAGIVAHLETADLERDVHPAEARRHTESAVTLARHSLEEARRMMGAMLPEVLDGRDLPGAITRLAAEWSGRTGVACEAVVTGGAKVLHRDIEVALLRIAQESLSNVWKHAGARSVTVTLSYLDDVVVLDVRDDGRGMNEAAPTAGFGLRGMRDRVEALGGTFALESALGEGTTVSATVPALVSETFTWRSPTTASAT
jgi:signal transduction histidine kinase